MHLEAVDMRRAGVMLAVALLHIIALMIFLHATFAPREQNQQARAILLRLFRPPPPIPERRAPPAPLAAPRPYVSAPSAITPAPPATQPGTLQGLHFNLFGCTPENLGNLSPEERARCGTLALAPNPNETNSVLNGPSRALDSRHWQRALARKQNPLLLPCGGGLPVSLGAVICLANGAINGFGDLDEAPGYSDPPVIVHVPNNGDPQPPPGHN